MFGGGRSYDGEAGDDDDEWYPPSPPVYDVADKLIEINKTLYDDPFSTTHEVTNRGNHSYPYLIFAMPSHRPTS